jgi:hypothetical protein
MVLKAVIYQRYIAVIPGDVEICPTAHHLYTTPGSCNNEIAITDVQLLKHKLLKISILISGMIMY